MDNLDIRGNKWYYKTHVWRRAKKIWVIQRNWLYNKMNHDYDYNPRNSVTNLLYDFNNETISTMTAIFIYS